VNLIGNDRATFLFSRPQPIRLPTGIAADQPRLLRWLEPAQDPPQVTQAMHAGVLFSRTHFDKGRSTITEHLKNIFDTGELQEETVCRDFRHTADDGKDYTTRFYNLDAIIAVGFRVNSARAIQFRQ
jgi:hypothetical protein